MFLSLKQRQDAPIDPSEYFDLGGTGGRAVGSADYGGTGVQGAEFADINPLSPFINATAGVDIEAPVETTLRQSPTLTQDPTSVQPIHTAVPVQTTIVSATPKKDIPVARPIAEPTTVNGRTTRPGGSEAYFHQTGARSGTIGARFTPNKPRHK